MTKHDFLQVPRLQRSHCENCSENCSDRIGFFYGARIARIAAAATALDFCQLKKRNFCMVRKVQVQRCKKCSSHTAAAGCNAHSARDAPKIDFLGARDALKKSCMWQRWIGSLGARGAWSAMAWLDRLIGLLG